MSSGSVGPRAEWSVIVGDEKAVSMAEHPTDHGAVTGWRGRRMGVKMQVFEKKPVSYSKAVNKLQVSYVCV